MEPTTSRLDCKCTKRVSSLVGTWQLTETSEAPALVSLLILSPLPTQDHRETHPGTYTICEPSLGKRVKSCEHKLGRKVSIYLDFKFQESEKFRTFPLRPLQAIYQRCLRRHASWLFLST